MQIPDDSVRAIMRPLVTGKLWLKVLAVAMIFTGAIQALTIIGILWAWLPIWLGVLLFQAAGAAEQASLSGDVALAERATDRLRLFFMIQGILLTIVLALTAVMMLLGGFTMLAGILSAVGSGY